MKELQAINGCFKVNRSANGGVAVKWRLTLHSPLTLNANTPLEQKLPPGNLLKIEQQRLESFIAANSCISVIKDATVVLARLQRRIVRNTTAPTRAPLQGGGQQRPSAQNKQDCRSLTLNTRLRVE